MPEPAAPRWWWPTSVAVAAVLGCAVGGLIVVASQDDDPLTSCPATAVARDVLPSVVTISVTEPSGAGGNGTGSLIRGRTATSSPTSTSSTAAVDGGARITVHYSNGATSPASVVGADFTTDLAVIKADDGADGRPLLDAGRLRRPPGRAAGGRARRPARALQHRDRRHRQRAGRYVPIPAETGRVAHLLDAVQTDAVDQPRQQRRPARRLRRRPGRRELGDLDRAQLPGRRRRRQRRPRVRDPDEHRRRRSPTS